MSFNGSGTFVINTAGQPVVANTVISATVFNALTSDLATGLSTCITKDGQTTVTANIPFGNNKITSLGAGTAATDASNMSQVQSTAAKLITVTGTDTITGTMSPALASYAAGQLFYFIANAANTGAMTINIDGLGAKSITRDGSTALIAGDVNTGEIVVICYDGTRFQMINAANSFGNTTINGTLTVTGNTGLQANVSITSALSVGGVFAVTGAATLGSTLAVTGKSDLPTVSTASMNAAVAVVTTGTVTNLTSTSASIASMNAGVALLTNATVTTLTATGASIASANIGNLQFTAASIASINAGVAVITNLTATGASIASANVGTAVITTGTLTNLTATSASVASANAAVALITTGTVTNLTATGASVASANVGTAVITGLTVTGASIASVNAATATLSGNLTLNGGTANGVLYLNASKVATSGTAITFDGTNLGIGTTSPAFSLGSGLEIQRAGIATLRLENSTGSNSFEIASDSTTNGIRFYGLNNAPFVFSPNNNERMRLDTSGNLGIGTTAPAAKLEIYNASVNATFVANTLSTWRVAQIRNDGTANANNAAGIAFVGRTDVQPAGIVGIQSTTSGGVASLAFLTVNGNTTSESMRLDSSGNLGLGVTPSAWSSAFGPVIQVKAATGGGALTGSSADNFRMFANTFYDGAYKRIGAGYATQYEQAAGQHSWYTAGTSTANSSITFTQAMTLDASGNLGLTSGKFFGFTSTPSASAYSLYGDANTTVLNGPSGGVVQFNIANSEQMRLTTTGLGIGTASPGQKLEVAGNVRLSGSQVGSKIENKVNAINVSTATTILDVAGSYGRLVVVNGYNAAGRFCDLVLASTSVSPTVVASFTAQGSPAARTYTRSGLALQLAMASDTYEVHALALGY